ncbi:MAG TPA: DUF5658 family protein [Urbifossiella sp.]|jgi:hypothetical protein|nr:DUF5658 family protein [Urbifossiella sp.]
MMSATRFCAVGLVFYAGLSLTDFALTYVIVRTDVGYESNPVADAWLHRHGWEGLAAFKALTALVFGASVGLIIRRRPRIAAGLVSLGCAALLLVVVYSQGILDDGERRATHGPVDGTDSGLAQGHVQPPAPTDPKTRRARKRLPPKPGMGPPDLEARSPEPNP